MLFVTFQNFIPVRSVHWTVRHSLKEYCAVIFIQGGPKNWHHFYTPHNFTK